VITPSSGESTNLDLLGNPLSVVPKAAQRKEAAHD
jgi:hypothetical protein